MADWNPAEIIGNNPNILDYSLYDFLIMDSIWHEGRSKIGYQQIKNQNLMVKFGNKPYVDIRASFNSLIPQNIKKKLRSKLISFYFQKLKKRLQRDLLRSSPILLKKKQGGIQASGFSVASATR